MKLCTVTTMAAEHQYERYRPRDQSEQITDALGLLGTGRPLCVTARGFNENGEAPATIHWRYR